MSYNNRVHQQELITLKAGSSEIIFSHISQKKNNFVVAFKVYLRQKPVSVLLVYVRWGGKLQTVWPLYAAGSTLCFPRLQSFSFCQTLSPLIQNTQLMLRILHTFVSWKRKWHFRERMVCGWLYSTHCAKNTQLSVACFFSPSVSALKFPRIALTDWSQLLHFSRERCSSDSGPWELRNEGSWREFFLTCCNLELGKEPRHHFAFLLDLVDDWGFISYGNHLLHSMELAFCRGFRIKSTKNKP